VKKKKKLKEAEKDQYVIPLCNPIIVKALLRMRFFLPSFSSRSESSSPEELCTDSLNVFK
jgi:hypothetical protein